MISAKEFKSIFIDLKNAIPESKYIKCKDIWTSIKKYMKSTICTKCNADLLEVTDETYNHEFEGTDIALQCDNCEAKYIFIDYIKTNINDKSLNLSKLENFLKAKVSDDGERIAHFMSMLQNIAIVPNNKNGRDVLLDTHVLNSIHAADPRQNISQSDIHLLNMITKHMAVKNLSYRTMQNEYLKLYDNYINLKNNLTDARQTINQYKKEVNKLKLKLKLKNEKKDI